MKTGIEEAISFAEQQSLDHSTSLKQQGAWLQWADNALPFDMIWKNFLWGGISNQIIKFVSRLCLMGTHSKTFENLVYEKYKKLSAM